MADGSIWIKIKADDEAAQKEIEKLTKKIEKTEKTVSKLGEKKAPLVQQAQELEQKMREARAEAARYNEEWKNGVVGADKGWGDAVEKARQLSAEHAKVVAQIDKIDDKLIPAVEALDNAKNKAGELEQQIASVSPEIRAMANAAEEADKRMKEFSKRVKGLFKRVLVFSLITTALRTMRDWVVKVIKTNDEATGAMAKLKGALLTLAQPLVNVIVPAFTALVNILTAVVGRVAALVSALFGTTASASAESAEALYEETEALEGAGSAAKKAGKSLAAFDEINQLSGSQDAGGGSSSEAIAPDFSWAQGVSDLMGKIADAVLLIAAGLAMWKIGTMLPGVLGTIATKLGGILIFIGGLILAWNGLKDAWENGVDWGNMAALIAGVAAAAAGLWLVFGKVGAGIALIVGGIAMLVTGFKDVIENGANLKNVLLIIAGIVATGLGIAALVGTSAAWIPLLIAGILSVITALVAWQGNMEDLALAVKNILSGIVDFFVGIFTDDMERALKGLKNIFAGTINAVIAIFESVINAIIDGLNWLIEKANTLMSAVGLSWSIPTFTHKDLSEWKIPYLAQGAVIPPNREFLAVLGDQKSGTNIETPLSTMVDAFRIAMRDMNMGGGQNEAQLVLDGEVLGKVVYKVYNKENRRVGVALSTK